MKFDQNSPHSYRTIPSSDVAPQIHITTNNHYHNYYPFPFLPNPPHQSQRSLEETASTVKIIKSAVSALSALSAVRTALFVWQLLVYLFHSLMK
ncbi:hypothetical protein GTQ43_14475 [Nostoc sp. KVJ3]|uniref:hypothetical protein n=1 Tax=Nostoc sp. KVJ3 TaxID=457945 RepID=UPI0022385360|nr:hypothetical protein [Nostoc sp. KVJ3]MCW5314970.1 hypothetical protein [Nostoc sp. KVJ3]